MDIKNYNPHKHGIEVYVFLFSCTYGEMFHTKTDRTERWPLIAHHIVCRTVSLTRGTGVFAMWQMNTLSIRCTD